MTVSSTNLRGEGRHGSSRPQLTGEAVQSLPPLCARPGSDRQPECSIIEFGRGRPQARFSFPILTEWLAASSNRLERRIPRLGGLLPACARSGSKELYT